jgi:chemotaxis protein MotB
MADGELQDLIIIKRRAHMEMEQPHGGIWKIAFADFMTAMMCFFLVMWLINAANEETRQAVASYFNPVKLANLNTRGLQDPQVLSDNPSENEKPAEDRNESYSKSGERTPQHSEEELFRDPYKVLAEIAAEKPAEEVAAEAGAGKAADGQSDSAQTGAPDLSGGEAILDPFDPAFRQQAQKSSAEAAETEPVQKAETAPVTVATSPPRQPAAATTAPAATSKREAASRDAAQSSAKGAGGAEKPSPDGAHDADKSSAGGANGQEKSSAGGMAEKPSAGLKTAAGTDEAGSAAAKAEESELQTAISEAVRDETDAAHAPQLEVKSTGEGILISLTDDVNFGMFAIGSAEPRPELIRVMERIAKILSGRPGAVVIRGHTDARPFRSTTYDNWRLSTDRAHMAYYMLVRGGLDAKRVETIEGYADRRLKNPDAPEAAENRRIEILLREKPT